MQRNVCVRGDSLVRCTGGTVRHVTVPPGVIERGRDFKTRVSAALACEGNSHLEDAT